MSLSGWMNFLAFRRRESLSCPRKRVSSVLTEGQRYKTWIPAFAGKTEREVDFQSTLSKSLGFEPKDFQLELCRNNFARHDSTNRDLGAPHLDRNHFSRNRPWVGGQSTRRSNRGQNGPLDAQPARPYRHFWNDPAAPRVDYCQFSVPVRLRQASAGEFLQFA